MDRNELVKLARAKRALQRRKAASHLVDFMQYDSPTWQPAAHLLRLCEALEAVERGKIRRLMVFMPPRHGKSEVCSKKFPSWYLGRNPRKEIILCSYAADLAYDFSQLARDTLREHGPDLWKVKVSSTRSAMTRWGLQRTRGGCVAAGVGGPITGRGAHLGIIDDPFKNDEEASSATYRDKVWKWYQSTFRTRLAPGGAIVLVMTRWHEDDLAGRLIKEMRAGGEQWVILNMPALAEENDPLGRAVGEPLWPEHGFDKPWAVSLKRTLGTYFWEALYQQHPSTPEGEILKRAWWKYYRVLPYDIQYVIQSWDMTFKDTDGTDFVVGQVWGLRGADKYLLDQVRARMDFPTTIEAVKALTRKWPQSMAIYIEDKANGPAVISTLRGKIHGIIPVEPMGSKIARVAAVSPQVEAGNVFLPDPNIAPWVQDFVEECAKFPKGAHDDQVDSMSQALLKMSMPLARGMGAKPEGW